MPNTIEVLLVEDNPADADLTREALESSKLVLNLSVVIDGEKCLHFLRRTGDFSDAPRPDLILLDLNLPRVSGREVLAEIKCDPALRTIPVVVLTSSAAETDVVQSYDLGANCYITKPVDLNSFIAIVESVNDFWFTVVKLPTRSTSLGRSEMK